MASAGGTRFSTAIKACQLKSAKTLGSFIGVVGPSLVAGPAASVVLVDGCGLNGSACGGVTLELGLGCILSRAVEVAPRAICALHSSSCLLMY